MTALTIAELAIGTDAAGRHCLNDLHKAAGGESRHTPGRFTITQQLKELAAELSRIQDSQDPRASAAGVGTFVVKELAYAYAMWISPAIHLKAIRASGCELHLGLAYPDAEPVVWFIEGGAEILDEV